MPMEKWHSAGRKQRRRNGTEGDFTLQKRSERKRMRGSCGWGTICLLIGLFCCCLGMQQALAGEYESLVRYSEIYDTREELPEAEKQWTDEEGTVWEWKSEKILTIPVTSRRRMLSGEVIYPGVGKESEIPQQAAVEVEDSESGQVFETELPLSRTEYEKERWEDNLEFTVTFHSYGADVYHFGTLEILHQTEKPPLEGCEEVLLEAIGLEAENCRLKKMEWKGESYLDENGILCRDAEVSGARRLWDCRAIYAGETALPDLLRYRRQIEYRRAEPEESTEFEKIEEAFSSEPERLEEQSEEIDASERFFRLLRQGLTVSIHLLFFAVAVWGFLKLRKRAEGLDTERKN